ncbi:MAG: cation:proton antiporter [Nitrosopumilaceae archaeon]
MISEFDIIPTIIGILFLVLPAMLLGRLCAHFKISEVIGFVVAGVILGPFALGGIIPFFDKPIFVINDFMIGFWQMSGIIILFSAGLHFTFNDLRKAGYKAATIGIIGVVAPLLSGYFVSLFFGYDWTISVLIGATLSTTSIAIAVLVLEEIGKEKTTEGNILVNAAVLDDVLGLAILSAVISVISFNSLPSIESIITITAEAVGFWFLILIASVYFLPKLVHITTSAAPSSLESRGINQGIALGSAFGMAAIASALSLNPIVGAFAAGMGLAGSKLVRQVKEFVGRLQVILAPLFFGLIGANVDPSRVFEINGIFFILILVIAVFSKILGCGLPGVIFLKNKLKGLTIGYGMVARGEVAFITAGIGLAFGILTSEIFSTLVFVILATIIISPTMLRRSFSKSSS